MLAPFCDASKKNGWLRVLSADRISCLGFYSDAVKDEGVTLFFEYFFGTSA
jgi:hypothetical protein